MSRLRSLPLVALALAAGCAAEIQPPNAVATAKSTAVAVGAVVELDGSASTDPNQPPQLVFHRWAFQALPPGSAAALNDPTVVNPSFTADVAGTYKVALVVRNSMAASAPAVVEVVAGPCGDNVPVVSTVTASPAAPGVDQVVQLSANVSDADNDDTCKLSQSLFHSWSLVSLPAGSRATLNLPDVRNPSFTPDMAGEYRVRLVVTDSTGRASGPFELTVTASGCGGNPPVVGTPVAEPSAPGTGMLVALSAAATDADNEAPCTGHQTLSWHWFFVSMPAGSHAAFNDAGVDKPSFVPDLPGTYVLRVRVTDDTGRAGLSGPLTIAASTCGSASPQVSAVTASPASPDTGQTVQLVADVADADSASDCGIAQSFWYRWSLIAQPAGSLAALNNPAASNPSFVADVPGKYQFELVVTDATGRAGPAFRHEVEATTCGNGVPEAEIQAPAAAAIGEVVSVLAVDEDADTAAPCSRTEVFAHAWAFEAVPAGSTARLNGSDLRSPSFVPDVAGEYKLRLVTSDATGRASAPAYAVVTVSHCGGNAPEAQPTASTLAPATGQVVLLTAAAADADNGETCGLAQPFAWFWAFDQLPAGSRAALNSATAKTPSFLVDLPGDYVVRLVATDPTGRSGTARLTLTASTCGSARPAATVAFSPATPGVGTTVRLVATATDADNAAPCDGTPVVPPDGGSDGATDGATDVPGDGGTDGATDGATDVPGDGGTDGTTDGGTDGATDETPAFVPQTFTYAWSFESLPAGSAATLNSAAAMDPSFTPDVDGTYVLRLVVTDSTGRASAPVLTAVAVSDCGAHKPSATITATPATPGVGQPVLLRAVVTDGDIGASGCDTGQTVTYFWSFSRLPAGSRAALNSATAAQPSFVPDLADASTDGSGYEVRLVVTDSTGRASEPVYLPVPVSTCGTGAPVPVISFAPAAPGVSTPVQLSAVVTDSDNDAPCSAGQGYTLQWTLDRAPAGSRATLTSASAAMPSFVPDLPDSATDGGYLVRLVATDSTGRRGATSARILVGACNSALPTAAPTASTTTPAIGQAVRLDAHAADDDNGGACNAGQTFSYRWSFESLPAGSRATLNDPGAAFPSFVPDLPSAVAGDYVVRVVVTDSTGRASAPKTVAITANACGGNAPTAEFALEEPARFALGVPARLNPAASADADNGAGCQAPTPLVPRQTLSYAWTLLSAPPGSRAMLSSATAEKPAFLPDATGAYAFRLVVTDSTGRQSAPTDHAFTLEGLCGARAPTVTAITFDPPAATVHEPVRLSATFEDADNGTDCQAVLEAAQTFEHRWRVVAAPAGAQAYIARADTLDAASLAPDAGTDWVLEYTVFDSTGRSGSLTRHLAVSECGTAAPVAAPAVDSSSDVQPLQIGRAMRLLANASDPDNGACAAGQSLSYQWWLSQVPPGSNAWVSVPQARDATLVPDVAGPYEATLLITDSTGRTALASVPFTVDGCGGYAPVPVITATATSVALNTQVQVFALGSTPSYDPDVRDCGLAQTLSYRWELFSAPLGSQARLQPSEYMTNPWFRADANGDFKLRLWVTDSTGRTGVTLPFNVHAGP